MNKIDIQPDNIAFDMLMSQLPSYIEILIMTRLPPQTLGEQHAE